MLNRLVSNILPFMPVKLVWMFSKRYIAGETCESGINTSKMLNGKGILVTVDLLGEFITDIGQARENRTSYLSIIEHFSKEGVQGHFSLKPTSFGLLIDKEVCYQLIREIVAFASSLGSFIRIDMEDSGCTDLEIELYLRLKVEFPGNVGLVLQSYLHRTENDLRQMIEHHHTPDCPLNFRLCKGIYVESEKIAFKNYGQVRENYLNLLRIMLENGVYVAIATHDKYLVEQAINMIGQMKIPPAAFEFQMLYGVAPGLRDSIVAAGHKMRLYVPFGRDWFGYCSRRMKENPKMVGDIVKAIFIRG